MRVSYNRKIIIDRSQEHGNLAAANHFSAKMSNPLAESTVRNFVRALSDSLSSEDKIEIGKFAFEFGIDECIDAFKEKHVSQSFFKSF